MNINKFFENEEIPLSSVSPINTQALENLCRKIDIEKFLCEEYSSDFSLRLSNAEASRLAYCGLFNALVSEPYDLKFLNTALKLNDLMLSKNMLPREENIKNEIKIERCLQALIPVRID